jgi:hypothetical protein
VLARSFPFLRRHNGRRVHWKTPFP